MINPFDLEYTQQVKLSDLYWKNKWCYLPYKVEKVGRRITLEEKRIESEIYYKEFTEFVNQYLNDPVFRNQLK